MHHFQQKLKMDTWLCAPRWRENVEISFLCRMKRVEGLSNIMLYGRKLDIQLNH